ncbi:hypothetical protein L484_005689 [Morus notabilis]|uniref:Uncharacterized protein n=1 Tax=Morus notabilis TaxID=981085 RepID=W9RJM2_9ROSA|nr:hypothetical protein L484_005689 [Morus notabilis]
MIYLDSDLMVVNNVAKLYIVDMECNSAMATPTTVSDQRLRVARVDVSNPSISLSLSVGFPHLSFLRARPVTVKTTISHGDRTTTSNGAVKTRTNSDD